MKLRTEKTYAMNFASEFLIGRANSFIARPLLHLPVRFCTYAAQKSENIGNN